MERKRATFVWKSGDLDAAGLRATLGPSAMALGGMLKHLARFEGDMALEGREQLAPWNAVDWGAAPRGTGAAPLMTTPNSSTRSGTTPWPARALLAVAMVENGPDSPAPSLRFILINMIEEYAHHNGHAEPHPRSDDGSFGHDPPRCNERAEGWLEAPTSQTVLTGTFRQPGACSASSSGRAQLHRGVLRTHANGTAPQVWTLPQVA